VAFRTTAVTTVTTVTAVTTVTTAVKTAVTTVTAAVSTAVTHTDCPTVGQALQDSTRDAVIKPTGVLLSQ
jgi:hypothetical protein